MGGSMEIIQVGKRARFEIVRGKNKLEASPKLEYWNAGIASSKNVEPTFFF
jgi:hypothetical protein